MTAYIGVKMEKNSASSPTGSREGGVSFKSRKMWKVQQAPQMSAVKGGIFRKLAI